MLEETVEGFKVSQSIVTMHREPPIYFAASFTTFRLSSLETTGRINKYIYTSGGNGSTGAQRWIVSLPPNLSEISQQDYST